MAPQPDPTPPPAPEPQVAAPVCRNCGTGLQGPYCHTCGQNARSAERDAGFLADAVEELTDYDSKTFRTLGALIWRPGYLSWAYAAGMRVRYVPPLRLFLNTTVLLVLALAAVSTSDNSGIQVQADGQSILDTPGKQLDSLQQIRALAEARAQGDTATIRELEALRAERDQRPDPTGTPPTWADWLEQRIETTVRSSTPREVLQQIVEQVPLAMVLLLPLAAVLHWALYRRRYRHYVPHLVFNLHIHTFAFGVVAPELVVAAWWDHPVLNEVLPWINLLIPLYYIAAVWRFYRPRVLALVWKLFVMGTLYLVLLAFTSVALVLYAILTM